jgi:hypothetical protein
VLTVLAAGGIIALAAAMGLATWGRHPAGHVDVPQGAPAVPIASAPEPSGQRPPALPSVTVAVPLAPPPEPSHLAGATTSPAARPAHLPAPQPSVRPLPGGTRPPAAAPSGGSQPAAPKASPSASDPFGDDRKG